MRLVPRKNAAPESQHSAVRLTHGGSHIAQITKVAALGQFRDVDRLVIARHIDRKISAFICFTQKHQVGTIVQKAPRLGDGQSARLR